jgi:hypothetical protein
MAVRALGPHVGKYWLGVALGAVHRLVHTPQGVLCLIVIKFGNRANRFPTHRSVAVLTG